MRIDPANRVIEVGNIIFTPALQRSCGATEAMYLMARHVFEDLGYRRYEWKCNAFNQPSRRAALRLGFVFEGVFRQHMIVKGRNRDTAWFSMLDSEWPLRKASFEQWLAPSNFDPAGRQILSLSTLKWHRVTKGIICDVSVIATPSCDPYSCGNRRAPPMMNSSGTVIGKGICIRGEVSGEEDFFLDGVLEGNITLTGKRLTVGANGVIHADIVAGDLVVFGRVEGSVKASGRAELKHSAVFIGDISAARLSIEDNATLQGYVDLTDSVQPAKKEPVAAHKEAEPEEANEYVEQYSEAV